jgi:hypothetical protein
MDLRRSRAIKVRLPYAKKRRRYFGNGSVKESEIDGERARDVAFHLSDWHADAAFIVALHLFPERFTREEIDEGVRDFLIHAPNHVAAAAALFGFPIQDIFEVGALDGAADEEDGKASGSP